MASKDYPPATLIATGQIGRLMQGIDTARLFPDYSKLYAIKLPDLSAVAMASLPDVSKLVMGSLPDLSKVALVAAPDMSRFMAQMPDLSKLAVGLDMSKLMRNYGEALEAAAVIPDMSKLMSSISVGQAFPDYSKLFSALDNVAVHREYEAAMPMAAEEAEALVVEEALSEGEPSAPAVDVWAWIKSLPPERKHHLAQRVEVALAAIVALAGVAMGLDYVRAAGMLLALAAGVHALYLFVKDELRQKHDQPEP